MSRHRAYVSPGSLGFERVVLADSAFHHARRVLRLAPGDELELFDGAGGLAVGVVVEVGERQLGVSVQRRWTAPAPAPPRVTLLCGELKGEKMDWVLQKVTELGVDRVAPVITARGEVRPAAAARERRRERHEKVVLQACRQSGRAYLPEVRPAAPLSEALAEAGPGYVLWESSAGPGLAAALQERPAGDELTVLVGPEGGLSAKEVAQARAAGLVEASLGPQVLRAETAAIAAVTLVCAALGRLG